VAGKGNDETDTIRPFNFSTRELESANARWKKGDPVVTNTRTKREDKTNQGAVKGVRQHKQVEPMSKSTESIFLDRSDEAKLCRSLREFFNSQGMQGRAVYDLCAIAAAAYFENARRGYPLPTELPKRGEMPLFNDREDRDEDPISFYERHWKIYADAGLLNRPLLAEHDRRLLEGMNSFCAKRGIDRDKVMPPTKSDTIEREIIDSGLSRSDIFRYARYLQRHKDRLPEAP